MTTVRRPRDDVEPAFLMGRPGCRYTYEVLFCESYSTGLNPVKERKTR